MAIFKVFDVAGSGLSAQSVRLNTVASNLANADVVSGTEEGAYRAKQPVFSAVLQGLGREQAVAPVQVKGIEESTAPAMREYGYEIPSEG